MLKRLIRLLLTVVMLLGMLSMTVLASENEKTTETFWTGGTTALAGDSLPAEVDISLLSGDTAIQTADSSAYENDTNTSRSAAEPVPTVTSTDALATAMRQAMVERKSSIQLRLNGTALTSEEVSALFEKALAHTGIPNEGDYIRANMTHYYCGITTGTDAAGTYSLLDVTCSFISDAEMEAEVDAAVEEVLNSLNLWDASNYEKVKGVYDWITEHVEYDYDWDDPEDYTGYYQHTTHAALITR